MRIRYLTAGILVGIIISATALGKAHRLTGQPKTLEGKLTLAKAQVRHDRREIRSTRQLQWTLLHPIPSRVLFHKWWLQRDLRYVSHLARLLDPRWSVDACLRAIIDRENPSWDPTRYNSQGSGAYGLPQALPGSKMASAGPDWRTNPWTQIRWMVGYVNARYGGSCAALAYWQTHGSY